MSNRRADVMAAFDRLAPENEAVVGQNNTTVNRHYFGFIGQPYCGKTLEYCMDMAGCDLLDACTNPAYVPTLRAFMEGHYKKVSNADAQEGDVWIYKKDQHTGFIRKRLSGLYAITGEGNWGGVRESISAAENGTGAAYEGIGYRKIYLDSDYEVWRPPYTDTSAAPTPEATKKTAQDYVKDWQTWLGVEADGDPGIQTLTASVGRLLSGLLSLHYLRRGDKGDAVMVVQGLLYALGYDPDGLDGSYGPGMEAAVAKFQADHGLDDDGQAGKDTVAALLTALQ